MAIQDLTASLDLKQNLNIYATCKQFDSLNLILSIYDNSIQADLTNYNVRLIAMKSDNVPLIQEHIGIAILNNVVTIDADVQLTTTSGKTPIELQFINKTTGKKKATFNLVLNIVPSTLEINATISTATYTLLQELENKLDQASDINANISEAISVNSTLNTTITNATTSKNNLDNSVTIANTTTTNLGTLNTTATTTKNALNTSITNANNSKSALDTSKTNADASKVALDTSISNANTFVTNHGDIINLDNRVTQNTTQLSDIVHLTAFKKIGAEADDTGRLQRAIDSFTGNFAGTILIAETIHVSNKITCNKTGLILQGVSNKKSKIISSYAGVTLEIKPLYNGNPYTNPGYCKFFANDIAIQAEGDAITSGTGLWLQWIYASSFINLYTSGFAKHIVLKGSHLNTFYNLYQENADATERGIEIYNRGVGLSGDGTVDEAGESTSNNNHIVGGWLHNCSYDFTNLYGTRVEKIDIEPASNSIITGDDAVFKDCRFERLDYYVANGAKYPSFAWFIVGNRCKFKDNQYYQSGASQSHTYPIFQVNGDLNEIEIPNKIPYNIGLISFGDTAKGNIINYNGIYSDYQNTNLNSTYKQEGSSIWYNNQQNRMIFKDNLQGTITDVIGSNVKAQGEFICRSSRNTNIIASGDYSYEQCTSATVDIALPIGRIVGNTAFSKITLNSSTGNRRLSLANANGQTVPTTGIYTLSAVVYIPSASSGGLFLGATLNSVTYINARDKWITVRSRVYLNVGEKIIPTFAMTYGSSGDVFYVGEISVCDGNTSVYIPNNTYGSVNASF